VNPEKRLRAKCSRQAPKKFGAGALVHVGRIEGMRIADHIKNYAAA
jgi:hypothetical protein